MPKMQLKNINKLGHLSLVFLASGASYKASYEASFV